MSSLADSAAGFLLNAAWQTAAVAIAAALASRLLARAPARQRQLLWVAALAACVALPFSSLFARVDAAARPTISATADAPWAQMNPGGTPAATVSTDDDRGPAVERLIRRRSQPVSGALTVSRSLAAAFALLVLCRLAWLVRAWCCATRLRRTARARELTAPMRSALERCRAALGLRRPVEIVCSPLITAPVTLGARRPVIILPDSFYEGRSEETLASVIGHELAHVARRDYALNLACELLLLPVCFHPLAHVIKRRIERARELACDEMVAGRVLPADAYARALVLVAGSLAPRAGSPAALGVFDADILEERIMRLTRKTPRATARGARLLAASAGVLLCLSCLALSTFSFELRASDMNTTTRASADAPAEAAVGPRVHDTSRQEDARAPERNEIPRADLARALASTDAQTRAQAACDAGRARMLELIPALVSLLGDDAPVRPVSCWASGDWSPALAAFKGPTPGEQAAIALASMGAPAFKQLAVALDDSSATVRRNAAWAVGELTNMRPGSRESAVPRLVTLLGDGDGWVRMAAARALGELRDERASAPLSAALSDGDWRVRELAAWSLGEMKDEGAVERLCAALSSDARAEVRATAAWALGEIQDGRAAAQLRLALNDAEPRVREKARRALSEIEGDDEP
ncbi:MAG TPA: M56 family metallopeptidase [Pyrinomonadaceae bacterium]|nr:M56 family metallopeptidase [Pyrinomonadaceae bacterium]